MATSDSSVPEPDESVLIPAATVLLIRDTDDGIETLMLRRNSKIAFGGMWVFPGGRVDDDENDPDDPLGSARRAAVRETEEEAGLVLTEDDLASWSYWIPPMHSSMQAKGPRRRFSTWFFVARAPEGDVAIDDGEIKEHRWMSPADALAMRDAGEIEIVPPTWVTLHDLQSHGTVDAAMEWARANDPVRFETKPLAGGDDGKPLIVGWDGDAGYESGQRDVPGDRHRLIMDREGWRFERT